MTELQQRPIAAAPSTYQDWLDCFARMKEAPLSTEDDFALLARGSFTGTGAMQAALERQMVEAINAFLNKSVKRFVRELNECIAFQELAQAEVLFKRLKKNIRKTTFFLELSFLPGDFKEELYQSITEQMLGFWNDTIRFLRQQAMDYANSDLEDVLFLIGRIRLFS